MGLAIKISYSRATRTTLPTIPRPRPRHDPFAPVLEPRLRAYFDALAAAKAST